MMPGYFRSWKPTTAVKLACLVVVFLIAGAAWSGSSGVATSAAKKIAASAKGSMSLLHSAKARSGGSVAYGEDRVTQEVNEKNLVTLARNTWPMAKLDFDRGEVSESMPFEHMLLVLKRSPQQEQELDQLIDEMNDKNSPNFHKWLTADQLGERFGVSDHDIDTLTGWLQSHGFTVNKVYANRMVIDFSGTAGGIKQGFHTPIHSLSFNGEMHLSNMRDPQIPAALLPVVKGIFSLNDFKPHAMYKRRPDYTFAGCTSSAAVPSEPGTCYAITPQDNQTIYNLNPLYNAGISGQGQKIVLLEDTDTYGTAGSNGASDWNTYRSTFGLTANFPAGTYTQVHPGGCTDPGTNGDDGEAAIDVEVASAIAPSAAIVLAACPSATFTFGGVIALENLVNAGAPYPGVVSMSYGLCEAFTGAGGNGTFYTAFQQAAAQGISVFASSGDEGPSSCSNLFSAGSQYDVATLGVTGWGESPYNVTVGGTDFEDVYNSKEVNQAEGGSTIPLTTYWGTNSAFFGSALSYIPEMPWNDACADVLISEVATNSFTPYGASPATCNNATFDVSTSYLSTGAGSGGASNCATGAGGTLQGGDGDTVPQCQGYPKPSFQTGASLAGGHAVYGSTSDGVRDVPDVAMFAANGVWGHFETVCWSDPSQTSGGATPCTAGNPAVWAGFGGTSVAAPTMAAVQALVNQKTGENWGNPDPIYYQIAQNEYGVAGGTFLGSSCNSSGAGGPAAGCAFNDVTQGDIDLACRHNGAVTESQCYLPTGTNGVDSTDVITAATVINGGTGYTTAPSCAIAGPTNSNPYVSPANTTLWAGGTQASCTAAVNSGSTNGVWTVKIGTTGTNLAGSGVSVTVGATTYTFVTSLTGAPANSVLVVTAGSTSTQETDAAKNLEAAINANSAQCTVAPCFGTGTVANASATATETTSTDTITAKTAGYAGFYNVTWGPNYIEGPDIITITNTTLAQGPNYVSGITISAGGSGYQPDTPVTLTGGGGSGAIAVANTSTATGSSSYQPTYGAGSGYDLATGLGTPNGIFLVNTCSWTSLPNGTYGLYSPASNTTFASNSSNFNWCVFPGATAYWLDIGTATQANLYYSSGSLPNTTFSQAVTSLPTDGSTVYVTWYYFLNGSWSNNVYTYTASGGSGGDATMATPTPSSTLTSNSVTFTWNPASGSPQAYWLDVGTATQANLYYSSGSLATSTLSETVNSIPTNGSTVYATLYTEVGGVWTSNVYTYQTSSPGANQAVLTSPAPNNNAPPMLPDSTVTFTWSAGVGAFAYYLDIGTTGQANAYYSQNQNTGTTVTVGGLPTDGSTVVVTLYTQFSNGGQWYPNAYDFTAINPSVDNAALTSPTPNNNAPPVLSGSSVTFTWSAGTGAFAYYLDIGNNSSVNAYYSQNQATATTVTVNGLPTDGSQVVVTLYTQFSNGGTWYSTTYLFTAQ